MEECVDAYLFLINMFKEETYYFVKNGEYRNHSYADVDQSVYANAEYMSKYMIGLGLSDYLMAPHLRMMRYLDEQFATLAGDEYLEIGPGGGQLLAKAIESGCFKHYTACDLSASSVQLSNQFLKYLGYEDKCQVQEKNFFDLPEEHPFDCIVMGEVLEHVEDPKAMLEKIARLLAADGKAYISTVINAPAIDHIYLFPTEESVLDLVKASGLEVVDYMCATAGNVPLERAVKRKTAIDIAMIVKRA